MQTSDCCCFYNRNTQNEHEGQKGDEHMKANPSMCVSL